jgi:hypothetical protein
MAHSDDEVLVEDVDISILGIDAFTLTCACMPRKEFPRDRKFPPHYDVVRLEKGGEKGDKKGVQPLLTFFFDDTPQVSYSVRAHHAACRRPASHTRRLHEQQNP